MSEPITRWSTYHAIVLTACGYWGESQSIHAVATSQNLRIEGGETLDSHLPGIEANIANIESEIQDAVDQFAASYWEHRVV